jgi:hypothetical protein
VSRAVAGRPHKARIKHGLFYRRRACHLRPQRATRRRTIEEKKYQENVALPAELITRRTGGRAKSQKQEADANRAHAAVHRVRKAVRAPAAQHPCGKDAAASLPDDALRGLGGAVAASHYGLGSWILVGLPDCGG